MPITVPTEHNPQGLRPSEHGRRKSLDQSNPEMQAFMDQTLARPLPDPHSTDPGAKMVWRMHVEQMGRIMGKQGKALEPPRPTAQDMHFIMKRGGPGNAPPLLLEILHALPEPHRKFMHGDAGVDILPDAPPPQRPRLRLDWTFPRAVPRPAPAEPPALDAAEFSHVRRFQRLDGPGSRSGAPPAAPENPATRPAPARPYSPSGSGDAGMIIIPDL